MSRNHVAWALLGSAAAGGLWWAAHPVGAVVMFASIGVAFLMWHKLGPRGSWAALVTLGVLMAGANGYEAVTGSRCPENGQKVFLKMNKPPVGCDEMRAGAGSMAMFFAIVALIGAGTPLYMRGQAPEHAAEHAAE